jgi:hypothetical protein
LRELLEGTGGRMNLIHKLTYTLELHVWEPQAKAVERELDDLAHSIKEKKILHHAGYVRLIQTENVIYEQPKDEEGVV